MRKPNTVQFIVVLLLLISCAPVEDAHISITPTFPETATETLVPTTQTPSPVPPSPTLAPTPIPTIDGGYKAVMQVATFDLWFQNQYPEMSLSISKLVFQYDSENHRMALKLEVPVKILETTEFKEVQGIGWSPGGKYFVYASSNNYSALHSWCNLDCEGIEVWITSNDGSYKEQLSSELVRFSSERISWSPDDTQFVTFCSPGQDKEMDLIQNLEICLVHIPSSEIQRTGYVGIEAQYSPTADAYVFASRNDDASVNYYLVQGPDQEPEEILSFTYNLQVSRKNGFVWSPDGEYIYAIQGSSNDTSILSRIFLDGRREELIKLKNQGDLIHSISPNGTYLLICDYSLIDPLENCFVYDIASNTSTGIADPGNTPPPKWLPNSTLLLKGEIMDFKDGVTRGLPKSLYISVTENDFFDVSIFDFIKDLPSD